MPPKHGLSGGAPQRHQGELADSRTRVPGEVLPPGAKREVSHMGIGGRVSSGAHQLQAQSLALYCLPLPSPSPQPLPEHGTGPITGVGWLCFRIKFWTWMA